MYGVKPGDGLFVLNCLFVCRFVECGVRFIYFYYCGWDHYGDFVCYMKICCGLIDKLIYVLV